MLDLERILELSEQMDDVPELTAQQAEQLARLLAPRDTVRRTTRRPA